MEESSSHFVIFSGSKSLYFNPLCFSSLSHRLDRGTSSVHVASESSGASLNCPLGQWRTLCLGSNCSLHLCRQDYIGTAASSDTSRPRAGVGENGTQQIQRSLQELGLSHPWLSPSSRWNTVAAVLLQVAVEMV